MRNFYAPLRAKIKSAFFFISAFIMLSTLQVRAQNLIVTENALTGSPASEWDIDGAGDLSLQGFATDISVNKGETVHFKIKTDATSYTIDIYRIGYYQGNGARKIGTGIITATFPQIQPDNLYDPNTGLTDCGNWTESAHWDVPANAVSGIYIARLKRSNGGASHIVFIVRDDASHSDLYVKTSDATWQAYNVYGGNSLYVGSTSYPSGHATKVSYNRPFITRNGGGGGGEAEDWFFNAEYPMVRWLERNGYDISYTTDVDADRRGNLILNHKVFLSVGHDEYWSGEQRVNVEAARNAGVNLGFFSGNEIYWKTRWEASTDGSNASYRTLVCYKEGTLGENACGDKCDPLPNVWTGLWRDGCNFQNTDGCRPENALSGQISWDGITGTIQVPDTYKNLRFWRNTSVAALSAGDTKTLSANTLGYEWDWEQYPNSYPEGRVRLSSTTQNGHTHHLSLYKNPSGALVFGAGTVQWSWGLDGNHDRGGSIEDADMQQATINLLADMGAQPGSLQAGRVIATASEDVLSPSSVIAFPLDGGSSPANKVLTISGTASDAGGVIGGVEISVDAGVSWHATTGTDNWSYTFTPVNKGTITIKSRAVDDIGNLENPSAGTTITISDSEPVVCPCTIWPSVALPINIEEMDNQAVELGVKFRSAVDGYITGIRFYKSSANTGAHIGSLWSINGENLAQVTFTDETVSGWQEATFDAPVHITANTTYIASYHTNVGHYSADGFYFSNSGFSGSNLYAFANNEDGSNGVYTYSAASAFPTQDFNASNYWVDVVFNTEVGPDVTPPVITSTIPVTGASGVSINPAININFNEALDPLSVGSSSVELRDEFNILVYATVSYSPGTKKISITPVSPLSYTTHYIVKIKGGVSDPRIKDAAGNPFAADYSFGFTTGQIPPPPPTDGPGGPILVISSTSNPFSRYPVEILRAEGFNEFKALDISQVNTSILNDYDVVLLGNISLSASQVTMLTDWVNAGGSLIALKPDAQLAGLFGLIPSGGTLTDKYLLVNTSSGPGAGIVNQTIQFHSTADLYNINGATSIATLYSDANTASAFPAVTMYNVGSNGGIAVAFTYDLARSVVYTRQGNPAWTGQKRDGQDGPIRSDDMFFPDWIDLNKVAIPQADEQQHLLSNIIATANLHRKPLPRFWFLPKGLKAAIVMTGDDHGSGGTVGRFNQYISLSNSNSTQAVADWDAIRSTSYIYPGTPITDAQALAFQNQGFEISVHVNTGCQVWTPSSLDNDYTTQLGQLEAQLTSIAPPSTHRTHCISWSDWASQPKIEAAHGIRLDANYYYWPESWIQNRSGMFTGSGMPMRFADLDGTLIDCYQLTTQMPDESGEVFPAFSNALLDKAIGPEGFYGIFCANMHTDNVSSDGSDAIITSAKNRNIPVISAKQMLDWLDGRNASSFDSIVWNNNQLVFSITAASGANNLKAMLPVTSAVGQLTGIMFNGSFITYETETIKGIEYAFFSASSGKYVASYSIDNAPPVITDVTAMPHANGTATITWTTNESSDSKVDYGTSADDLLQNQSNDSLVTIHSVTLNGLNPGVTYYYKVTSTDVANNSASESGSPTALNFTLPVGPCIDQQSVTDFMLGTPDANTLISHEGDGAIILKPAMNEEFSGNTIPVGWSQGSFNAGETTIADGLATVNGTHLYSNNSFGPGVSIEFVATYNLGAFQNIGLSNDQPFDTGPWVTIGQGQSPDGNLYARASDNSSINLGSNLLGAPHLYRIKWNTNSFEFYVDGSTIPAATINLAVSSNMFIQISDVLNNDGTLSVDWMKVSPYASGGSYTSKIFDQGSYANWSEGSWDATIPAATNLSILVRTGNTAIPDETWSNFIEVINGSNIAVNSRYLQYRADFYTSDPMLTPELKSIEIACNAGEDHLAPVITNVAKVISGTSATISWNTNEMSNSIIEYGTSANLLNQSVLDSTMKSTHSLILNGLIPGITYYYRVISTDGSSNSATEPNPPVIPLNLYVPFPACFTDQLVADFNEGTNINTYISNKEDGEIILKPSVATEFSVPPSANEWNSFSWTGGNSTISNGTLVVDGARYNTEPANATFGPGSSVEFVATFGAGAFGHIGFGGGTDDLNSGGIYTGQNPWAMFSTGNTSTTIKARTFDGNSSHDVDIPGNYIGTSHLYRIEWTSTGQFNYYIDGLLVNNESSITINSGMRVAISDYNSGGSVIELDWIHIIPYTTSGNFISRVYNAGEQRNWGTISWTSETTSGESSGNANLFISVRTGNTPAPDETWTAFSTATNGGNIGVSSQYIQYKAELITSNALITPILKDVTIGCSPIIKSVPVVTANPQSQIVCSGSNIIFNSEANGIPVPVVQWQESKDGLIWSDVIGAVTSQLTITAGTNNNGNQYRAVWTNDEGSAYSSSAILTVNAVNVSVVYGTILCRGDATSVTVNATGGTEPYNGTGLFSAVAAGSHTYTVTDANGCQGSKTIWISQPALINPTVTVVDPITCNGGKASVLVNATGGTLPYTGTGTFNNVAAGSNTFTVTDANGCQRSKTIWISQPTPINVTAAILDSITCYGGKASVIVTATGGIVPYTGTGTFNNIAAGSSTFTVTDANGCQRSKTTWISQPSPINVTAFVVDPIVCNGGKASVTVTATGGTLPYTGTGTFNDVTAGSNTFTVTDVKGCSRSKTIWVTNSTAKPPAKPVAITGQNYNVCGSGNFTYSINEVPGATSYNWSVPAGLDIVQNNGTSIVLSNISSDFTTSGKLSVTASNSCGASAAQTSTLYAVASDPGTINGPTSVLSGQTVTYFVTNREGIIFTWAVPLNATIISGQGTSKIRVKFANNGGSISVFLSNSCGNTLTKSVLVTVASASSVTDKFKESSSTAASPYLKAFPNPTTSSATIIFNAVKQGNKYEILVTDVVGKTIIKTSAIANAGNNTVQLDLGKYANGMYIVTLITDEETRVLKLYKEK